jgi:hypothetical protein
MSGLLFNFYNMESLQLTNNKKLLKIKLTDLNSIEYIKETIFSVLNNP